MTNLISQGDRIEINFELWTNTPIPAKAWFELLLWPGGYDDFRMLTMRRDWFEIRYIGVDEMKRHRIRVTCLAEWNNDEPIHLGVGRATCAADIEPWAYTDPVFRMRADGGKFTSSNLPVLDSRIIPSGQPIARSSKYPALAVIYSVNRMENV